MLEKIIEILKTLDIRETEITEDTRFREDLELDSLDLLELLTNLEEKYKIKIAVEDLTDCETVGSVMEYLKDRGVEV